MCTTSEKEQLSYFSPSQCALIDCHMGEVLLAGVGGNIRKELVVVRFVNMGQGFVKSDYIKYAPSFRGTELVW